MSNDAMQQALEALEYHQEQTRPIHKTQETIAALRQAIEQAEMQKKLCKYCGGIGRVVCDGRCMPEQTPDDLLRQSEREGWRYAKECEAEIKRLTDLNRQLVAAAKELGAADDVHEWDDAWAKMAKLMRQGEINATSSQDGR
jgi:hypothetical protein